MSFERTVENKPITALFYWHLLRGSWTCCQWCKPHNIVTHRAGCQLNKRLWCWCRDLFTCNFSHTLAKNAFTCQMNFIWGRDNILITFFYLCESVRWKFSEVVITGKLNPGIPDFTQHLLCWKDKISQYHPINWRKPVCMMHLLCHPPPPFFIPRQPEQKACKIIRTSVDVGTLRYMVIFAWSRCICLFISCISYAFILPKGISAHNTRFSWNFPFINCLVAALLCLFVA